MNPTPALSPVAGAADEPLLGGRSRVLVIDDQPLSRDLILEMLAMQGHEAVGAGDGPSGLELARTGRFDLVLLDISMPGMSGLEVCRTLRGDPLTAGLPVIAVTSLADREHRLEGIAAGANDYLTKPVDRSDLLLRVRNALQLSGCHRRLTAQYHQLRELEALRDGLVHMLVHDLKGPLTGVVYILDAMSREIRQLDHPALTDDIEAVFEQTSRLTAMVNDVLDVSRAESVGLSPRPRAFDVAAVAREAVAMAGAARRPAPVEVVASAEPVTAMADVDQIRRVLANLIGNADKFSREDDPIRVSATLAPDGVRIEVADRGPGVPKEEAAGVFAKFARGSGSGRRTGVGLGLTFCKLAVEANGGRIGVTSEPGQGAVFWLTLPVATAATPGADRRRLGG